MIWRITRKDLSYNYNARKGYTSSWCCVMTPRTEKDVIFKETIIF